MNGLALEGPYAMEIVEILFNINVEQCRELGARGGRIHARNLRLRKAKIRVQPVADLVPPPMETVHEASLLLNAQFPWLAAAVAPRPKSQKTLRRAFPIMGKISKVCLGLSRAY